MFGFLQKLFGGIFAFLGNLLQLPFKLFKPKTEFFLEYDEATSAPQGGNGKLAQAKTPAKATKTPDKAPAAAPAPVAAAPTPVPVVPVVPVKTAPASNGTFAPTYLNPAVTASNGRRRPGATMNSFLEMARQAKTSR
jgi:hypothetical protein